MKPQYFVLSTLWKLNKCYNQCFRMHLAKYQVILRVLVLSCFSHVQLFATPWTVACLAPLSMGFPRQDY